MIHLAMESDVSAENALRLQQTLGKPRGFPTDPTATTTTGYSWCPPKRGRSEPPRKPQRHRDTERNTENKHREHRKHEGTKTRTPPTHRNLPTDHADNARKIPQKRISGTVD